MMFILIASIQVYSRVNVVATTTDLAALADYIGGEYVNSTSLSRPMQDAHYLDATPGMVVRISRADLFIENGMELEMGWVPEVLRQTRNRAVRPGGNGYVNASNGIEAIQIPDRIHRDMGDVHPSGNPHYTLEPVRSIPAAKNIAMGLGRVDPQRRDYYMERYKKYKIESKELLEKWQAKFKDYIGAGVIVYHKHFDYMLFALGLEVVDSIEPLPGLAPSARHIAQLLSSHSSDRVKLVITEPWHDRRVAMQVADGLGIPMVVPCPTVGSCDGSKCIFSLFESNANMILNALLKTTDAS